MQKPYLIIYNVTYNYDISEHTFHQLKKMTMRFVIFCSLEKEVKISCQSFQFKCLLIHFSKRITLCKILIQLIVIIYNYFSLFQRSLVKKILPAFWLLDRPFSVFRPPLPSCQPTQTIPTVRVLSLCGEDVCYMECIIFLCISNCLKSLKYLKFLDYIDEK